MGDVPPLTVILVGNTGVGKTSLLNRRVYGKFSTDLPATVGIGGSTLRLKVNGKEIELKIWDTAGQEQYESLIPMFSRGANAAILVAAISDAHSFDRLPAWAEKVRGDATPVVVAINKIDLKEDNSEEENKVRENFSNVMLVSAKTGQGVSDMFQLAGEIALEEALKLGRGNTTVSLEENTRRCC